MAVCAAPTCRNSYMKGFRMFVFPADPIRRNRWMENSGRELWNWKPNLRLCEVHFEESQYENRRQDHHKKLKPNAIPTIFNPPEPESEDEDDESESSEDEPPPKRKKHAKKNVERKKQNSSKKSKKTIKPIVIRRKSSDSHRQTVEEKRSTSQTHPDNGQSQTHQSTIHSSQAYPSQIPQNQTPVSRQPISKLYVEALIEENKDKADQIEQYKKMMASFLTECQIKALGPLSGSNWDKDTLTKCYKLRFALGKQGYEYLRKTGYPAPSTSTLNRQIKNLGDVDLGVECVHYESDS